MWLCAQALAGPRVEVSLRTGDAFQAELLSVSEDCAGSLRSADGASRVLGTNALDALWFPERLDGEASPTLARVQIQGFFPAARARVDGADAGVVRPGDVLAVGPGRHLIYLDVPACGKQRVLLSVDAGQVAPVVFNRPLEQHYVAKAIVTGTVGALYIAGRLLLSGWLPV